ncbi:NAD(P)/FAD-dependent oxidoreductase [Pontibacter sp. BAB1700]|uniref:phytoene desaturase family protein n=1 Tax=Pontibacter sp. BAB1700 TaxID=1144253 RepID=UPI00026BDE19|nr:NAD(P)/FAD-dependent oxidoreductase [Pontibacter sp. BAB1700]EJF08386.1 amine oxidase [Pontibacter sp. BAB1700]
MQYDVILIGSGFGSLTAATLLAQRGLKVAVLEQAKYPGGCASSYKRKGYWFETGATTLVGLDEHMPLRYLLDVTGIELPLLKLDIPMQVYLSDGQLLTRYAELDDWIKEAERVFEPKGQRAFWEHCFQISQKVWRTSLEQKSFPFSSVKDLWQALGNVRPHQLSLLPGAFRTMEDLLARYGLLENKLFKDFVNEQLLITAQNHLGEVNELFGATALCYTLFGNYYVKGGMIGLARALESYLHSKGSTILYRRNVHTITSLPNGYEVNCLAGSYQSRFVISGIPLNDTYQLFQNDQVRQKLQPHLLPSAKLNGAFTMALVLRQAPAILVLHHQVHVPGGLPLIGSSSFFVSYSHPADSERAMQGERVVAISTHVRDPAALRIENKRQLEEAIIKRMEGLGLLKRSDILHQDSSTPGAWIYWTQRAYGMVGGYPQYRDIKPWQMKDARLDHKGAYTCGDSVYPGQGIVGVCLSGIIAANKLVLDHF